MIPTALTRSEASRRGAGRREIGHGGAGRREAGRGGAGRDVRLAVGCAALGLSAGAVAAIGLFARGDEATRVVTSTRGEAFPIVTEGIYAGNASRLVAEGIAWDAFTLVLAVPAMLLASFGLARGSLRARLLMLGLLAYFFYQYLMYAMAWAFGPLFVAFIALYASSLAGIVAVASTIDLGELRRRVTPRFPSRAIAYYCFAIAVVLVVMWSGRITAALHGDSGVLLGQTTLVVPALDLGLVVPLALFTGILSLERRPLAYALGVVFVVKGLAMSVAISWMVVRAGWVEGSMDVPGLVIFVVAASLALWLGIRTWRALPERTQDPHDPRKSEGRHRVWMSHHLH